jgi:hypothetical protein
VVVSFALSCTFLIYTVITACLLSRKGFEHPEIESLIIIDDEEQTTVKWLNQETLQGNDTIQKTCNNSYDTKMSENDSADLNNIYNEPSQEAKKIYGPVMIR